jgi:hypothetical protein
MKTGIRVQGIKGPRQLGMQFIYIILMMFIFALPTFAANVLTKGEVVDQLSATDIVKDRISQLINWSTGYDSSKINRLSLVPTINYISIMPKKIPPDGRTVLLLTASVSDPKGQKNISGVRADLSSIGKYPNMTLVDNGLFGDQAPDDSIFTIQSSISSRTTPGEKEIPVIAANKKGWKAVGRTLLVVGGETDLIEVYVYPQQLKADGKTELSIKSHPSKLGEEEGIKSISVDLSELKMNNDNPMAKNKDDIYSFATAISPDTSLGRKKITVRAVSLSGKITSTVFNIEVVK